MMQLFLFLTFLSFGQNVNRPVPPGFPAYEFRQNDTNYHGYYCTTPFQINATPVSPGFFFPFPMILDEDGYMCWFMSSPGKTLSDFNYFPDHHLFTFISVGAHNTISYKTMDTSFNIIDSVSNINNIIPDAHEFQILLNGNYLIGGLADSIFDLSMYTFNGNPGSASTIAKGYVIQEFDKKHHLVFQWNSNNYINPSQEYDFYGYDSNGFDYCHSNAFAEDLDGNLLISFRHLNAIYKIDNTSGHIIWKLGGKSGSFSFTNDPGFSGQHSVRKLPDGNISIFDNANMSSPPRKSRAVEYSLDTLNMTATKVWSYVYSPPFFSSAMGNNELTTEGFHLINSGLLFRPHPSIFFVDENNNILTELFFKDSIMSYRSYIYDISQFIKRPEISCSEIGGNVILTAPNNHKKYLWTTGDTTQSIILKTAGTYQVWVDYGAGMAGSSPFFVTNIKNACQYFSIKKEEPESKKCINGIFDLLGRRIDKITPGQVYILQFIDGRFEKRFNPDR